MGVGGTDLRPRTDGWRDPSLWPKLGERGGERTQTHGSNRVNGSCLSSIKNHRKARGGWGSQGPAAGPAEGFAGTISPCMDVERGPRLPGSRQMSVKAYERA